MFDYESVIGQVFIKDRDRRLKSFNWTDTGIKLTIPDINKHMDLGKYRAEVSTMTDDNNKMIEIREILGKSFAFLCCIHNCKNILHFLVIYLINFMFQKLNLANNQIYSSFDLQYMCKVNHVHIFSAVK